VHAMRRLTISARFRSKATQPCGLPPEVDIEGTSEWVSIQADDESDAGIHVLSYTSHAQFTGESTFTERGRLSIDEGDAGLDFASVAEGSLGPTVDSELHHGSVIWRIERGHGRFQGASGLITSNFLLCPSSGEVDERQVAVVFLP
jgi:hypothetical protein